MRFLATEGPGEAITAVPGGSIPAVYVQGVPYDGGVSWRAGAAEGPAGIRDVSESIESYSHRTGRDLEDYHLVDVGDVDPGGKRGWALMQEVATATERLARAGAPVLTFGGDHSISIGTSSGLRAVFPDLAHVVFDAHLDMREEYEGDPYSHACGTRHMAKAGPTCALGIRSGSREEFTAATDLLVGWSREVTLTDEMRAALADRPVFLSVDLDVLDPSIFPGTGTPEAGGATYRELEDALLALSALNVVGIDLVECAPPLDPDGPTPYVAAKIAREVILGVLTG